MKLTLTHQVEIYANPRHCIDEDGECISFGHPEYCHLFQADIDHDGESWAKCPKCLESIKT